MSTQAFDFTDARGSCYSAALATESSALTDFFTGTHSLDGRDIDTRTLRGKVVIVTFWATWCGPCRQELPLLSRYRRRARARRPRRPGLQPG